MSRPAESPGGLVNTDPALDPPGWFWRRQRTISAISAAPASGSPRAEPVVPGHHHLRRADGGVPVGEGQARGRRLESPRLERGRPIGRTARVAAVSEPWPPAFMRMAPPTEPGTPTAHSRPRRPAAAVRRASTGRLTAAPADHVGPLDLDGLEAGAQGHGQTGKAAVGHQEVRAPPHDEDGDPGARPPGRRGPRPAAPPRRRARPGGPPVPPPGRWCGHRAAGPAGRGCRGPGPGPRGPARRPRPSPLQLGQELVGQRGEVAGAQGEHRSPGSSRPATKAASSERTGT